MRQNTTSKNRTVIIIADSRPDWDNIVHEDPSKANLNPEALRNIELSVDGRFLSVIDLVNAATLSSQPSSRDICLISQDDYVTLNGVYLGSFLKGHAFDPVLVRDFCNQKAQLEAMLKLEPLAVVLSTTFCGLREILERIAWIKSVVSNDTKIVIGGPTIYSLSKFLPGVLDYYSSSLPGTFLVVERRGERSLVQLLEHFESGGNGSGLPNVIAIDGKGKTQKGPEEPEDVELDHNIISWAQLSADFRASTVPLQTSHGCPFRCAFCTFWTLFPEPIFKSTAALAKELDGIVGMGCVKHIMVTDDLLNISKSRILDICRVFSEKGNGISWSAFLRSKPMDREIAIALRQSNCSFVNIGVESFDDEILVKMNKRETVADHLACIEVLKSEGIGVLGSFVFGFPGETESTVLRTVNRINASGLDFTEIYGFIFYPQAPVASMKEFGLRGSIFEWQHCSLTSKKLYTSIVPKAVAQLDVLGLFNWDNWSTISLLVAAGFSIDQVRNIFSIRRKLIRQQTANQSLTSSSIAYLSAMRDLRSILIQ